MTRKINLTLFFQLTVFLLTSCSTIYQVLETSSPDAKLENDSYVYENSDLRLNYNFWASGGRISFLITNKTDDPIYLDWNKSHLIYNGISYEYWYDEEETNSFYSEASTASSNTFADEIVNIFGSSAYGNSKSTTSNHAQKVAVLASSKFKPKKVIQIPPKCAIKVTKFSISKSPYFNCDFNLSHTSSKTPITKNFTKNNSPLTFRNYLTYSSKESFDQNKTIDNEFYITTISFMNKNLFLGKSFKQNECDVNGTNIYAIYDSIPFEKPNSFYIKVGK